MTNNKFKLMTLSSISEERARPSIARASEVSNNIMSSKF